MLPTCRGTADEPAAVDPVDTVAHGIWQLETEEGFINLPYHRQCPSYDWQYAMRRRPMTYSIWSAPQVCRTVAVYPWDEVPHRTKRFHPIDKQR
jgi:hypothetical protein